MSLNQLLRRAVALASVALTAEVATAQNPPPATASPAALAAAPVPAPAQQQPAEPAPLNLAPPSGVEQVVPAAGRYGPFGQRGKPCPPLYSPHLPCPPAAPSPVPPGTTPTTPPTTPPTMPPTMPPGMEQPPVQPPAPAPAPAPAPDFGDFGGGAGVGQTVGLSAPNLFGDLLGGRATQIRIQQPAVVRPGALSGSTFVIAVTNVSGSAPGTVSGNFSNATLSLRSPTGQLVALPPTTVLGIPVTNPLQLGAVGVSGAFTESVPVGVNVPFTPSTSTTGGASANYILNYLQNSSTTPPANVPFTIPPGVPVGSALVASAEKTANPQATLQSFTLSPVEAIYDGSTLSYASDLSTTVSIPGQAIVISIPTPGGAGGGGVVGLVKISEDNNPMPRDRVIFNYDYFSNVPYTATGIPVNRYQFGVEKTFIDGRTSLEVRVPFASTINSDGSLASTGTNTEFGNVRLAGKVLLLRRETVNVSTGLGVYLPTADDVSLRGADGREAIRVRNSSVQLAPFGAVLWTPGERFFSQAWVGATFDTGGNQVTVNPMLFGGTANVGNLRAATLLTADLQLGYWMYLSDTGYLRGLAPFVELHYNGAVSNGSVLNAGSGFFIGDTGGNFDELNMTAGVTARLGEQANLAVGFAAPLRNGNDRTFDYQIGVRFNWFFGYTARNMTRGTNVSTFGN